MANHCTFLHVRLIILLSFLSGFHADKFAGRFLQKALEFSGKDNVIVSPFSAREALAQVYVGVRDHAADELHRVLQLSGYSKSEAVEEFRKFHEIWAPGGDATLKIANRIFVAEKFPLLPKYMDLITKSFRTGITNINFEQNKEAASIINQWISKRTKTLIKKIVNADNLDKDFKLMVISAIYFHGKWETPFDPEETVKQKFFALGEGPVKVDMMHGLISILHGRINDLDAHAVEIPYMNSNISMLVILPNKQHGLLQVENLLHTVNLFTVTSGFKKRQIELALPKFSFEFDMILNQPLKEMGIRQIFQHPDFRDMTSSRERLYVSEVIQKAVMKVNEDGSRPVTGTVISTVIKSRRPQSFIVDHPFLFAIKDQQRVFFAGRVKRLN
ncbi:serine protease inhibitor 42Dd-like [Scaptodrosophila lebanonensis]|uniref:Serine protease inhibitor 42Dd-like n=1 Tax=Drosophila lebanonensis TaxID=7225 RepID=A0A6J2TFQ1_DROLE|nr:serine protease inhibitor 42Dd-like [Scaptodrosophila lebanonensis]